MPPHRGARTYPGVERSYLPQPFALEANTLRTSATSSDDWRVVAPQETRRYKMTSIFKPLRIILDTNHVSRLRDMARARRPPPSEPVERTAAYRVVKDKMDRGELTPVVGRDHAFDWVRNRDRIDALQTGAVLDSAANVLIGSNALDVWIMELLNAARAVDGSLRFESHDVLMPPGAPDWSARFLATHFPDVRANFPDERVFLMPRRTTSIRALAGEAHRVAQIEIKVGQDVIATFKEDFEAMKARGPGTVRGYSRDSRMDYVLRRLKLREVLETCSPRMPINDILDGIRLEDCPGLDTWFRVLWVYFLRRPSPNDTDHGDLSYIHLLPYTDLALLEKGMCSRIREVDKSWNPRVFATPEDLVAALVDR